MTLGPRRRLPRGSEVVCSVGITHDQTRCSARRVHDVHAAGMSPARESPCVRRPGRVETSREIAGVRAYSRYLSNPASVGSRDPDLVLLTVRVPEDERDAFPIGRPGWPVDVCKPAGQEPLTTSVGPNRVQPLGVEVALHQGEGNIGARSPGEVVVVEAATRIRAP